MKLNFWQILGVLLIMTGIAVVIYRQTRTSPAAQPALPVTHSPTPPITTPTP